MSAHSVAHASLEHACPIGPSIAHWSGTAQHAPPVSPHAAASATSCRQRAPMGHGAPTSHASGAAHTPSISVAAPFTCATLAFQYVIPSQPQTGAFSFVTVAGLGFGT